MAFALPRPLSHSSLTMYGECPQRYKFKYVDNLPEKPRHYFSFGSSVHEALEFFYGVKTLPPPTLEEVLAYFKGHWKSAGYKDQEQEEQYFEDGRRILTLFYRKHVLDFRLPLFVEYQFNLAVAGVPVTGKVDRVDKLADGRLAILDYKTGKALARDRAQTDAQLTMYQMACEELLGAEVARLAFYHLPSLTEHSIERHPKALVDALRRRIVGTAESISKARFEASPDENKCRWCDYKPVCPVFRHQYPAPGLGAPLAAEPEGELVSLIDRYGELRSRLAGLEEEAADLEGLILAALKERGYVRAFGRKFEVARAASGKWEFTDKGKLLEIIKSAGLYDRILAPSAPKVEKLMEDLGLHPDVRARLTELGAKTETSELKVKPL